MMTQASDERIAALRRRLRTQGFGAWIVIVLVLIVSLIVLLGLNGWSLQPRHIALALAITGFVALPIQATLRRRWRRVATGLTPDQRRSFVQAMEGDELRQRTWPGWFVHVQALAWEVKQASVVRTTEPTPADAPAGRGDEPTP
jgi:hypothetical protein